jgi:hypothetical protein
LDKQWILSSSAEHWGTMGAMKDLHTLVVYVPATHTPQVLKAIGDAGAGRIGNYSHCSFVTSGTGRFTPQAGAAPYVGGVGTPEEVPEDRIECVVEAPLLKAVVAALRAVHPYEEPAFMSWKVEGWRSQDPDSSRA